jgi:hypothetical protein
MWKEGDTCTQFVGVQIIIAIMKNMEVPQSNKDRTTISHDPIALYTTKGKKISMPKRYLHHVQITTIAKIRNQPNCQWMVG